MTECEYCHTGLAEPPLVRMTVEDGELGYCSRECLALHMTEAVAAFDGITGVDIVAAAKAQRAVYDQRIAAEDDARRQAQGNPH